MPFTSVTDILILTLIWFIVYWVLAGIVFAIVAFIGFNRINTLRFSCLFTLMSLATAFGAVLTGFIATSKTSPECLNDVHVAYRALVGLFKCAVGINLSNAVLWFGVLLVVGLGVLYISTIPARRSPPQVH